MACEDVTMHLTVYGGIAISNHKFKFVGNQILFERGTVGFVATIDADVKNDDRNHFAFVTNKHVIDAYGPASEGSPIYSFNYNIHTGLKFIPNTNPPLPDESQRKIIGYVKSPGFYENKLYNGKQYYVDAASVKIDTNISSCCGGNSGIEYEDRIRGLGLRYGDRLTRVHEVTADELITTGTDGRPKSTKYKVFKVGKTSNKSEGHLFSVTNGGDGYKLFVISPNGEQHLIQNLFKNEDGTVAENIMVIIPGTSCTGQPTFSEHGDSGSALVNENNELIGLLCAESRDPVNIVKVVDDFIVEEFIGRVAFACHIKPVIELLGITPITHPELIVPAGDLSAVAIPDTIENQISFPVGMQEITTNPLRILQDMLTETEQGRFILSTVRKHQYEIGNHINRNRKVMVVWRRVLGPAFTVHFLNNVVDPNYIIPKEINGITLRIAIIALINVLKEFASSELLTDISNYEQEIFDSIEDASSIGAILEKLTNSIKV